MARQYEVTSVGVNPVDDRAHRMRMYFIAMSIRVACIVSLVWVRGFWIVVAALGAILLPYFAVLIANAVSHVGGQAPPAPSPLELQGSATHPNDQGDIAPHTIVIDAPADRRSGEN